MSLFRTGLSTGTCAAAAAKAAAMVLAGGTPPTNVVITLPGGESARLPVLRAFARTPGAEAAVLKDAGDDPDVTNAAQIVAAVSWAEHAEVRFRAGAGVGVVTRPGLSVAPGEPAINPVPRRMIRDAVRQVTTRGVDVTIAVPGGAELAARTYNPRLGIIGGLSILGTTGRVRPFSTPALEEALRCSIRVARASGVTRPVIVPGNIGERGARRHFRLTAGQLLEASNHWGFVLDELRVAGCDRALLVGHPGKLCKLADGHWDTHSSRSPSAVPTVARVIRELQLVPCDAPTVEGLLGGLPPPQRRRVAGALAGRVNLAVAARFGGPTAVALVDMQGTFVGSSGELSPWL